MARKDSVLSVLKKTVECEQSDQPPAVAGRQKGCRAINQTRPDSFTAPRASDGKPDLSGVRRVEATPLEEQKRLFGNDIEKLSVPGMERDKISKYALDILADFKPEDTPMRPEAAALLLDHNDICHLPRCRPQLSGHGDVEGRKFRSQLGEIASERCVKLWTRIEK